MVINEIYTIIVSVLKTTEAIDWPWSAILIPELIWLIVYLFTGLLIQVGLRKGRDEPPTKDEWRGID